MTTITNQLAYKSYVHHAEFTGAPVMTFDSFAQDEKLFNVWNEIVGSVYSDTTGGSCSQSQAA